MISGTSWIGNSRSKPQGDTFRAWAPASGQALPGQFYGASAQEVDEAVEKATAAFRSYRNSSGEDRAAFLEAIADEILGLGDELIERACSETGLPEARIIGERGRTMGQLRLFAQLVREGSWVNASIDTALPDREPIPKPDIRTYSVPTGPVAVFTASNFPLAFSTAGGDTASALAAGCPVIVKAHESHPGTNELVAGAVIRAAQATGMPDGIFSSLNGIGYETGKKLVTHPGIKSVAFTGSFGGGTALFELAAAREEPIPVFAEMGSINPVVLFPDRLGTDAEPLAAQLAGSIILGSGQFCTNPGMIVGIAGDGMDRFIASLAEGIGQSGGQLMLNKGISRNYAKKAQEADSSGIVEISAKGAVGASEYHGTAMVARASGETVLANPSLQEEVFGPYSLVIECSDPDQLTEVLRSVKGQLTTTAMASDKDVSDHANVIKEMEEVAGRLIFNGVPTGVEVCHSMHHGGPFPATTDPRSTSVGTEAIKRFVRPLCFQSAPAAMLPPELQDGNPLGIWRKINGEMSKGPIHG